MFRNRCLLQGYTVNITNLGSGITPSDLKITSWNVNGLRSIIRKNALQQLANIDKPDFLCLNETRIDAHAYNLTKIHNIVPQYHHFLNECKIKKGYSGVGIMTKHLPLNVYHDFEKINQTDGDLNNEGRLLTLQFDKFFLLNVYKPNAGDALIRLPYRMRYDQVFNSYVQTLNLQKPTVIVGDFNVAPTQIDLTYPKANTNHAGFTQQERINFSKLLSKNMIDGFRFKYPKSKQYTWWSNRSESRARNIGWRIDHVVVHKSLSNTLKDVKIMKYVTGSDHCPIQALINFNKKNV